MKRLTEAQKDAIGRLRASGLGYKSIANMLSVSRDTVRSFCLRNDIAAPAIKPEAVQNAHKENADSDVPAEVKMGSTVFIIRTSHSEKAAETLEKKLEKLILNDVARQAESYYFVQN